MVEEELEEEEVCKKRSEAEVVLFKSQGGRRCIYQACGGGKEGLMDGWI